MGTGEKERVYSGIDLLGAMCRAVKTVGGYAS